MFEMCCGIDDAIKIINDANQLHEIPDVNLVINRLKYHRRQECGVKPKYFKADSTLRSYYQCGNCGRRVDINDDFCGKCGYRIKWDSCRCLTGLPLVDAAEKGT